jgi:hypothetical protein
MNQKNLNFNLEAHQCRIQGEGVKAESLGGISIQLTSNQIEEIVERKPQDFVYFFGGTYCSWVFP